MVSRGDWTNRETVKRIQEAAVARIQAVLGLSDGLLGKAAKVGEKMLTGRGTYLTISSSSQICRVDVEGWSRGIPKRGKNDGRTAQKRA